MKCYYTFDIKSKKKVLIPGCIAVSNYYDIELCTCHSNSSSFAKFEKDRYNKILNEKNQIIKELESELKNLQDIFKHKGIL